MEPANSAVQSGSLLGKLIAYRGDRDRRYISERHAPDPIISGGADNNAPGIGIP